MDFKKGLLIGLFSLLISCSDSNNYGNNRPGVYPNGYTGGVTGGLHRTSQSADVGRARLLQANPLVSQMSFQALVSAGGAAVPSLLSNTSFTAYLTGQVAFSQVYTTQCGRISGNSYQQQPVYPSATTPYTTPHHSPYQSVCPISAGVPQPFTCQSAQFGSSGSFRCENMMIRGHSYQMKGVLKGSPVADVKYAITSLFVCGPGLLTRFECS